MLPYKDRVDRLLESEKVSSRVNVAVHRFGREIDVVRSLSVNCTCNNCIGLLLFTCRVSNVNLFFHFNAYSATIQI